MISIVQSQEIEELLCRISGLSNNDGNPRLKLILHDFVKAIMQLIEKHDISENEFWGSIDFLDKSGPELGLIVPGIGLEHFMDLYLDARAAEAGRTGGTPRTIEGPLYVAGAPLEKGEAKLTDDAEDGDTLHMSGSIYGPNSQPVKDAILHVWHADTKGNYSHFDPSQSPFNNRRRLKVGSDGRYSFTSTIPSGYSIPAGGTTDQLMTALGRHGKRPAHVHFFVEASGLANLTTQINIADDPFLHDDFAFATRDGLVPVINRSGSEA